MDDELRALVLTQVFRHQHDLWVQGAANSPTPREFVQCAITILGVSLLPSEINRIAAEIEDGKGEQLPTYDDLAWFLIRRVREASSEEDPRIRPER